ncbi:hypothetical protein BRADI_1g60647v3 [Brachypodium distachyon]|uniref:Uncharacterized protein n=1 Tax=Brachypodium distachyon TaxID=15368 RepID=A0A0Q3KAI2_BRADI|nr:hypothetical protein BRADI_1g60647v3 [Brachypodium distachyon]
MGSNASSSSSILLCTEDSATLWGDDGEVTEGAELVHDYSGFSGPQLESDELVESLMAKEREQLTGTATGLYLERLSHGGLELSCRNDAIDWICKVQARYSFGPLCVYLAVNYLDRFLSSKQLPACGTKYVFEANAIQRMEVLLLSALEWRMHSVTPFSYIAYFLNKFNEEKPLTNDLVSRSTDLILDTLKVTKFLQFRPCEIAAAVALSVAAEARSVDFHSALAGSKIPLDKQNARRCHEAIQEMALVKKNTNTSASPSAVLDATCFSVESDDNRIPGISLQTIDSSNVNDNQACSPASKRTKLS